MSNDIFNSFKSSTHINHNNPPEIEPTVFFLGLSAECGEVCDEYNKAIWKQKEVQRGALCSELGDVLWYITMIGKHYDINLEDMMVDNMLKRTERAAQAEEDREVELYTLARLRSSGAI